MEGPDIRKFEYPLVFLDLIYYLCGLQIYYDQGFTYDSDPSYESSFSMTSSDSSSSTDSQLSLYSPGLLEEIMQRKHEKEQKNKKILAEK